MEYLVGHGRRQKLYDKLLRLSKQNPGDLSLKMLKIIGDVMMKYQSDGSDTWYEFLKFNEESDIWDFKTPDDASDELKDFFNHIEEEFDVVDEYYSEHREDSNIYPENAARAVGAIMFDDEYLSRILDEILQYLNLRWEFLENKVPKLAKNTEWFDEMMEAEEAPSKAGKWFYNTRDTNLEGKIVRVYDSTLLTKIKNRENPFTRTKWDLDVLRRFSINEGGGEKDYYIYNNRKYLVRTGPRGGKFILVQGAKKRI